MRKINQFSLIKFGHTYILRYKTGDEEYLIKALAEMAENPNNNFDWFDAAIISYQVGRKVESELEKKN